MSSKNAAGNNEENRRRNPSRGIQKGTVGDIADAFKRQMAANSPTSTPAKTGKKNSNNSNNSSKLDNQETKAKGKTNKKGPRSIPEDKQEQGNQSPQGQQDNQDSESAQSSIHSSQEFLSADSDTDQTNTLVEQVDIDNTLVKDIAGLEDTIAPASTSKEKAITLNHDNQSTTALNHKDAEVPQPISANCDNCNNILQEINNKLDKLDTTVYDPKNGLEVQLGKLIHKVNDIHSEIHGATGGLKVRMDQAESKLSGHQSKLETVEQNITRMSTLLSEYKRLSKELTLMQGLIQKNSQQSKQTANKVLDLTKRGMEQNLIIHGVEESFDEEEDPKEAAIRFIKDFLEVDVKKYQIWKAHRMGLQLEGRVRPLIIKVSYIAKDNIMDNVGKLKGLTNAITGNALFIGEQIPEGVAETRKHVSAKLKNLRDENDAKPKAERKSIKAFGDKIVINGELYKEEVLPPEPMDLFVSAEKQQEINQVSAELVETEPVEISNSVFIGLALQADSVQKVNSAYKAVSQRFPAADHIMMAYGLRENGSFKHGNCDDGEFGGSVRIKKVLTENKANNTTIFVVRRFGGLHIGANRFKTIEQVAQTALRKLQA